MNPKQIWRSINKPYLEESEFLKTFSKSLSAPYRFRVILQTYQIS